MVKDVEPPKAVNPFRNIRRFSWIAVAAIIFLSFILSGQFDYSFIKKTILGQEQSALAKSVDNNDIDASDRVSIKRVSYDEPFIPVETVVNDSDAYSESSIPVLELDKSLTYSIPEGYVALTFDDGPSIYSKQIVDILKSYEVGGTFFFVGFHVNKYPEHVQYVHENGYSIGSHSINHTNFTTLSYEKQEIELIHTVELIENVIQDEIVLFRPPYGAKNDDTIELMNQTNSKMVLWNKDTEDWKHQNSDAIFNYVRDSETSGAIILLHESEAVIEALPRIIEYLQNQGLQIVSLK